MPFVYAVFELHASQNGAGWAPHVESSDLFEDGVAQRQELVLVKEG
jgi:hypothetical protein